MEGRLTRSSLEELGGFWPYHALEIMGVIHVLMQTNMFYNVSPHLAIFQLPTWSLAQQHTVMLKGL